MATQYNWVGLILLFFTLSAFTECTKLEVQPSGDPTIAQNQLQQIQKQAKHMKYGQCWTEALEVLHSGCRKLNDEMQRRIAYAFARCHLQSAGRDIPECKEHQAVSECTNENVLKDSAFNTYTEFFTHTQQICFHLQSQVWHEATETTISRLADNSEEVAISLEHSSEIAQVMVNRQTETLENQEKIMQNDQMMRDNMLKSVSDVQKSHEETKAVIREQRILFAEVFDRVAALQKTVLGEFTSIYTFGFYVGTCLLVYILTSTARTASARFWMFGLITLNFAAERLIVNYRLSPDRGSDFVDSMIFSEDVYADLWRCRKIFSFLSFLAMLACIFRYKDYNKINNDLLKEIQGQNKELQNILKEQGITSIHSISELNSPAKQPPSTKVVDIVKNGEVNPHFGVMANLDDSVQRGIRRGSPSLRLLGDSEDEDDVTFIGEDSGSDSSVASSAPASRSRRSGSVSAMMRFVRRSSTPSRELVPLRDSSSSRRSSVASVIEELNESVAETQGVIVGGYNLRRRTIMNRQNPILKEESVKEFVQKVANLAEKQRHFWE